MNLEQLHELIVQARRLDPDSQEWEKVVGAFADLVLPTCRITRPSSSNPTLSYISDLVCRDAHAPLKDKISQLLEGSYLQGYEKDPSRKQVQKRLYELRDAVLKKVLTHKHFDAMAYEAKKAEQQGLDATSELEKQRATQIFQAAMGMLYESTKLANQFTRRHQGRNSPRFYNQIWDEAFNQAWLNACNDIDRYKPEKPYLKWFNYLLDYKVLDAFKESLDPFIRGLIDRAKRQMAALKNGLFLWMKLNAKCKPLESAFKTGIYWLVLALLQVETRFYQVDFEDKEFPYNPASLLSSPVEAILELVEQDPEGKYQKAHLPRRTDVSFQTVFPLWLLGYAWPEIGERLDVNRDRVRMRFRAWLPRFLPDFEDLF